MSARFVIVGAQGEVSAAPDRVTVAGPGGVNGIVFLDLAYARAGWSFYETTGFQVGTGEPADGTALTIVQDGATHRPSGGVFLMRGPGQTARSRWTGPWRARLLMFAPEAVERLAGRPLSQIEAGPVIAGLGGRMRVHHLLSALCNEPDDDGPPAPIVLETVALAVLHASGAVANGPCRRDPALSAPQAERVRALIEAALADTLNLRILAEAVGLSEGYFARAFKGSFGLTPYQFVLRERVALAQTLIRGGGLNLNEVAARAGFPDARRMGRTVRQVTGRSPTGATRARRRP